jgi:DNA-binding transcriptional LysR family regulator|tara:strand:- start:186 stop:509 length:324 start_codon:yes stop_codon:yes gene_type:complete
MDIGRIDLGDVTAVEKDESEEIDWFKLLELANERRQRGAHDLLVKSYLGSRPDSEERDFVLWQVSCFERRKWDFHLPFRRWLQDIRDTGYCKPAQMFILRGKDKTWR